MMEQGHIGAECPDTFRVTHWQEVWQRHQWRVVPPGSEALLAQTLGEDETLFIYRSQGVISAQGLCHLAVTGQRLLLISGERNPAVIQTASLADVHFLANKLDSGPVRRLVLGLPDQRLFLIAANQAIATDFEMFLQELRAGRVD